MDLNWAAGHDGLPGVALAVCHLFCGSLSAITGRDLHVGNGF